MLIERHATIRRALRTAALCAPIALAACGGGGGGSSAPAIVTTPVPSGTNPIPPVSGAMYLGVWARPNNAPVATTAQNIAVLETAIGRKFAISMHYDQFGDAFPSPQEQADLQNNRIPLVSLNCNDTDANIAAGSQDALLIAKAAEIKAAGKPVFLRYNWEFNLPVTSNGRGRCIDPARDASGYFSAPQYIAAYRHIHDLMLAQGATNIAWVWNPGKDGINADPYFPGDAYVDWVGLDAYDRNATQTSIFAQPYAQYAHIGNGTHPMIVAETGSIAGDQVAYFDSAVVALKTLYPDIKALVYFDAVGPADDYSLTPEGQAAFARFATDPYLLAPAP